MENFKENCVDFILVFSLSLIATLILGAGALAAIFIST
jgi:hypothetical protein